MKCTNMNALITYSKECVGIGRTIEVVHWHVTIHPISQWRTKTWLAYKTLNGYNSTTTPLTKIACWTFTFGLHPPKPIRLYILMGSNSELSPLTSPMTYPPQFHGYLKSVWALLSENHRPFYQVRANENMISPLKISYLSILIKN